MDYIIEEFKDMKKLQQHNRFITIKDVKKPEFNVENLIKPGICK